MAEKYTFESALERLENLVSELESGEVQLDEMLKKYEEGTRLIKFCQGKLDQAEKQIKLLSGNKEDGFELEDFSG